MNSSSTVRSPFVKGCRRYEISSNGGCTLGSFVAKSSFPVASRSKKDYIYQHYNAIFRKHVGHFLEMPPLELVVPHRLKVSDSPCAASPSCPVQGSKLPISFMVTGHHRAIRAYDCPNFCRSFDQLPIISCRFELLCCSIRKQVFLAVMFCLGLCSMQEHKINDGPAYPPLRHASGCMSAESERSLFAHLRHAQTSSNCFFSWERWRLSPSKRR